jgi:shikimate 5-dehydrogenase
MLVHQGASSEKIWLNVDAPVELMRKVVEEKLRAHA